MTITVTSVLHGSSTQATSNVYTFGVAVAAGSTLLVGVQNVGTGSSFTGCTDSQGNTYTVVRQSNNSASGNDTALLICNVATALTTSDALTVASGAASSFSQIVRADSFDAADLSVTSSSLAATSSGSDTQTVSATTATSTAVLWAFNQRFTSSTPDTTYTDGNFTETTPNPVKSLHSNVMQTAYAEPAAAGSYSAVCVWGGNTSSGYAGVVVLDTAPLSSLALTGVKGAAASADSRYGALTTPDPTLFNLTGKKTAHATTDGRFGEFTNQYLNFGGVAWADARFGDLSSAAALTALTGLKGAASWADSRFGSLTTNTRGNLRITGPKRTFATADARFGLLSLIGRDLTGLKTASALADARFGYLLLHNRTPGFVTVRTENKGLVTIRIGD